MKRAAHFSGTPSRLFAILLAGLLTCSVSVALQAMPLSAYAEEQAAPVLSYDKFTFQMKATQPLPRPQWETWESVSGDYKTQMIVVDFPNLGEQVFAFSAGLDSLRKKSPEIRRLMALKIGDNTLRLVIEVINPPADKIKRLVEPKVRQVAPDQVSIMLFGALKESELSQLTEPVAPISDMNTPKLSPAPDNASVLTEMSQLPPAPEKISGNEMATKKNEAKKSPLKIRFARPTVSKSTPIVRKIASTPKVAPPVASPSTVKAEQKVEQKKVSQQPAQKTAQKPVIKAAEPTPLATADKKTAPKLSLKPLLRPDQLIMQKFAENRAENKNAESLQQDRAKLQESLDLRNAEIQLLKQQLAQANKCVESEATLKQEVETLKNKSQTLQSHLDLTLAENMTLQETVKALKTGSKQPVGDNQLAVFNQLQQAVQERNTLKEQLAAASDELSKARSEMLAAQSGARSASLTQIETLTNEQVSQAKSIEMLRTSLQTLVKKLKTAEEQNTDLRRELATIKGDPSLLNPLEEVATPKLSPSDSVLTQAPEPLPESLKYKPSREVLDQQVAVMMAAIETNPANTDSYYQLYKLYVDDADFANAERVMNNLLLINPQDAKAYLTLSELYVNQKQPLKAKATLDTFQRLNPKLASQDTVYQKLSKQVELSLSPKPQGVKTPQKEKPSHSKRS